MSDGKRTSATVPPATAEVVTCHHRNVTAHLDEHGRHLNNRCDDCGYTVTWAHPISTFTDRGI